MDKEKFASQADPRLLATMRKIAQGEGRLFQSVLGEAMQDYIDKKTSTKPRAHVANALQSSMRDFHELYKRLAQ